MRVKICRLFATAVVAAAVVLPSLGSSPAMAAGTGGVHFAFPQPPIAPAGSIAAGGSLSFTLRVHQ